MVKLGINNQEVYLDKNNKFVVTDSNNYLKFIKAMSSVNNKEINSEDIEVNGLKLTDKNSLVIDFSSITSYCQMVYGTSRIKDEYVKLKLENYEDRDKKQIVLNSEILKILNSNYKGLFNEDINVDLDKIVKQYVEVRINSEKEFFKILKYIIEKSLIKQYILIYSKALIEDLKIEKYIEEIDNDKMVYIEICTDNSTIKKEDTITFVQEMFYQISGSELYKLIQFQNEIENEKIEKYFFKAIKYKEDDNMEENNVKKQLNKICKDRFKLIDFKDFKI